MGEHLPGRGAVQSGGLLQLLGHRENRGVKDQHVQAGESPAFGGRYRNQDGIHSGQPRRGEAAEPDRGEQLIDQAGRLEGVDALEEEGDRDGRDDCRQQVQGLGDLFASSGVAEQVRHEERNPELKEQAYRQVDHGVAECPQEDRVSGEHLDVVAESHRLKVGDAVPGVEAEHQRLHDREGNGYGIEQQRRDEKDQHRGAGASGEHVGSF